MSETTSGIAPSAGSKNLFDKLLGENPVPTIPPPLTTRQHIDAADAVHDYDATDIELLHAKTAAEMQIQTGVIVDQARATATEIHRDVMNARPGRIERVINGRRKLSQGPKPIQSYDNSAPVERRKYDGAYEIDSITGTKVETPAERRVMVARKMGNAHVAQFGGSVDITDANRVGLKARQMAANEKAKTNAVARDAAIAELRAAQPADTTEPTIQDAPGVVNQPSNV